MKTRKTDHEDSILSKEDTVRNFFYSINIFERQAFLRRSPRFKKAFTIAIENEIGDMRSSDFFAALPLLGWELVKMLSKYKLFDKLKSGEELSRALNDIYLEANNSSAEDRKAFQDLMWRFKRVGERLLEIENEGSQYKPD